MAKMSLPPDRYMYPRPALLVGANVDDKPNFMAVGGGGVANGKPPMIGPPVDLVKELDYCGIVSGRDADKTAICRFEVFYGTLKNAPMIEQCPLNHECRVMHILNLGTHSFVIGQVEGSYVDEDCAADGKPDAEKIQPMIFNMEASKYLTFGETIAKAFSIGRELKKAK
jgi:flavin reductase (DIM6/NTAB) family NADH-FMN oxidoreductase RutF